MANSRRQQAESSMGLDFSSEDIEREKTLAKEQERRAAKEAERKRLRETTSYTLMESISKCMDTYQLDPIIGFFLPGFGDVLTSFLALPFIYFALVHVRSIPLTLAVIVNVLTDALLGSIPCFIGDVVDVLHRGYRKNMKLIVGYVDDDETIIGEVNRKAAWFAVLIVILCLLIYWVVGLVVSLGEWVASLF